MLHTNKILIYFKLHKSQLFYTRPFTILHKCIVTLTCHQHLRSNEHFPAIEKERWNVSEAQCLIYQATGSIVSFIAQLVEHCTGVAEVMVWNPVQA